MGTKGPLVFFGQTRPVQFTAESCASLFYFLFYFRRPLSAVTPNDTMTELGGGGGDQSVTSTTPPYVASSSSPTPSQTQPLPPPPPPPPPPPLSSAPKGFVLTKEGYYSRPPVNEIKRRLDDGQPVVQDLVVGRSRFGEVLFTGDTDVSDINVDELGKSYRVRGMIIISDISLSLSLS